MQIRQSTGQNKNVKRDSKEERTERTKRGYSTERNTGRQGAHKTDKSRMNSV